MHLRNLLTRSASRTGIRILATCAFAFALVLCSKPAHAQENPDPSLGGVTRSFIEANGLAATTTTSGRGVNQNGAPQIPRSGFDLINDGQTGVVLLRGVRKLPNGSCDGLTDDAYFLIHVAGRPGDADGNGVFNTNSDPCATRRGNNPANPRIIDGSAGDVGMLTFGENIRLRLDRNCDGDPDIVFSLSNDPSQATFLRVESDQLTGKGGTNLGLEGVAWEAAVFPGTSYGEPCPDPAGINGYYILKIANWSSYFAAQGLNPGDFSFIVTGGSDDDGLEEDLFAGAANLSEPQLSISKFPDLSLCPNAEGEWTIVVGNNGNAAVKNIVVTDALPAGVTLLNVVSGGVTPSGTTGTITFSPFDLAQCESKTIVIRVKANVDCSGDGVNSARADGKFETLCGITPGSLETRDVSAGPATANFHCLPGPCVNVTCTPDRLAACPGQTVNLTVRGTNCGNGPARITLHVGAASYSCPDPIAAGDFCEHSFAVVMPTCTSGNSVTFPSSATIVNDCTEKTVDTPNPCAVQCKNPVVQVDKSAEVEVQPGEQVHYVITVTNPSKDTDLENVVVVDELCSAVSNPTNFGGTCNLAAPQVVGSTITWPAFNLAAGASCTITFEATAAGAGGTCTVDLDCHNVVNVTANCGDAQAQASDFADTHIPCTPPGLCRLTGGGCLNEDGSNKGKKQSTFGGNSSPEHSGGQPSGNSWEHVYRENGVILFNWHSWDAHVIACSVVPPGPCHPAANNTRADFVGTGKYSLGAGSREEDGNQVAYIIDHKEGACNRDNRDEYSIVVRKGLVIGQGDIVFQTSGEIDCGNLQIHETPARIFGSGLSTPEPATVSEGVALLNRVIPNPFVSSMSFAYEVPEGGAGVEVGIYNVAGRLVKTLASGSQSAGRQSVTWDGTDQAGVRLSQGVYFLKAHVGAKVNSYRVIYMAR